MTYDNIKKRVGKAIKYYTDAGGWLTGRDVTEDDIGQMINQTYRDELFPMFATQYAYYFRQTATADSWIATGTVDATSTGTTLVTTGSVFANSMVGLYVWNDTDNQLAKITGYTSNTTVTLDTTIDNTWDGDSIYVLGQEYVIGGDASDIYVVEALGIKYSSSDQYYYITGNLRPKFDLFQWGGEQFSRTNPQAYMTNSKTSGGSYADTIGILPQMNEKVEKALELTYIAIPPELSNASDQPRLPVVQELIYGATAKAFRQKGEFDAAERYEQIYQTSSRAAVSRFRPVSTGFARQQRMPRRFSTTHRRMT